MDRRWDKSKPPRGPFALNRDCLAAQGLVLWYPVGAWGSKAVYDMAGTLHGGSGSGGLITGLTPTRGTTGEPALAFANGSSSVIDTRDSVPVSALPLSVGMWFAKTTASDTTGHALANISRESANDRWQFDTYNGDLRWIAVNTAGSSGAATKSGIVSKRWHHALGIEISATSRYAVLDGVAGSQNTTSITVTTPTKYWTVGAHAAGSTPTNSYFSGQIGEVCVWNRSVYAERQALADPAKRFELWYPLRSRKWFTQATGGGLQSIAIGQVTETDTAQALKAHLLRAVGQVAETDTAQALAVGQSKTIGQVTEVHTAQAFDADLVRAITIVAETDTAQAVQARLTLAVGQVAETDTAQAVSAAAPNLIVQVSETDIAQTIQADVTLAIGQVAETHLAQVLQVDLTKAIGQVNETDTAQAVQVDLTRAIGQVNETDTAQTLLPVQPSTFAQVVEVHTAQALFADQLLGIGRATQTDTAQAMVVLQTRAITLALEIDLSQPLQADLTKAIGQVNETDLASAFLVVLGGEGQHIISPRLYLVPDENRVYLVPDRDGTYSV